MSERSSEAIGEALDDKLRAISLDDKLRAIGEALDDKLKAIGGDGGKRTVSMKGALNGNQWHSGAPSR